MALAAVKRLLFEHAAMPNGAFNPAGPQPNFSRKNLRNTGFGGVLVATAKVMRPLGMRIHAINRAD